MTHFFTVNYGLYPIIYQLIDSHAHFSVGIMDARVHVYKITR